MHWVWDGSQSLKSRNGFQQGFAHDTLTLAKSFPLKLLPEISNLYAFTYSHSSKVLPAPSYV